MKSARHFIKQIILSVALLAMAGAQQGCSSPIEKAFTTSTLYSQAQQDVIQLRQQGVIKNEAYGPIADADLIVTPLMIEMNRAAVQAEANKTSLGKQYDFNKAWDAARQAVNVFLVRVAQAKDATEKSRPKISS